MRLSEAQRRVLLQLMGDGPREGITDKRVANALSLKKLVRYDPADDSWTITPAGRAALAGASEKIKFERPDGSLGEQPGSGTVLMALGLPAVDALRRAQANGLGVVFGTLQTATARAA